MTLSHGEITATMLTLGVMLASARLLGEVAKALKQPAVVGEILAGIILGPTVLGSLAPGMMDFITPTDGTKLFLNGFSTVAVTLFLLVAGMEVDLTSAWRQGKTAISVSVMGVFFPFILGYLTVLLFPGLISHPDGVDHYIFALFFATALSISALPVIAKTLMDLGVYRTDMGMVVVSAAMIDDLFGWLLFAVIIWIIGAGSPEHFSPAVTFALTLAFVAGALTIGRRASNRIMPLLNARTSWPAGILGFSVSLAFFAAAFTEWIGIHAVFGAFIVGTALGDSPNLRQKSKQAIEQFVSSIFAPIFFAGIGLKMNFAANFELGLTTVVILIACLGKIGGCGAGALIAGAEKREALAIGLGMNARGAMEIILATLALQYGIIGPGMFVALVAMAVVTSMISGPAMKWALGDKRAFRLADLFRPETFINPLGGEERDDAIAELSAILAGPSGLNPVDIRLAALHREKIVPTGLDNGVAIPHARMKGLAEPMIAVGISREGIDFDAPDGQPAQVIFLILTPENDNRAQIEILAQISALLRDSGSREKMKKAKNFGEFAAAVKEMSTHRAVKKQTPSPQGGGRR
ncbi:MAG: cation:proton antiporter [Nitrospinae bacterium]|nr:cation:proton antiporter [Nitrospinota bacterium]